MKSDRTGSSPSPVPSSLRPQVAVVLGLIGVRAAAAIPLFEFLEEEQIAIDLLLGTSGGAWLAAMRGAGYSPAQMQEFLTEMERQKVYSQLDFQTLLGLAHAKLARPGIGSALRKVERQKQMACRIFGTRRLEELQPATVLQTSDCVAGGAVPLSVGDVADAVCAASALTPYFPPQQIGGRWLADGAFVMPVPVLEAVKRHADVIIALYYEEAPKPQPKDLLEANYNLLSAYLGSLIKDQNLLAIDLHHHEIVLLPLKLEPYIGPWDTAAQPALLQAGRQAVERGREEILAAVRTAMPAPRD
ncbi:MAG TPA: patatin-like phospholipase family protein [Blastocatellia bacterium]|nr:patatin-like phospholipase family protein [Blastocatellia bacterium]